MDGNHMIRICGAVTKRRLMTFMDALGIARELLRHPSIRNLYESDALAPSSAYHLLARKTA